MPKLLAHGPHSERRDVKHSKQSLAHSVLLLLLLSWPLLLLGLFRQAPEETGDSSRLASPGTGPFLESPPVPGHALCTCPGQQLGREGGCSAQLPQACVFRFAAESIFTLFYYNQILLSRVCFLFLLIFVYTTRGSYQSPQAAAAGLLRGTARLPCPSLQRLCLHVVFQSSFCRGRNTLAAGAGTGHSVLLGW